MQALGGLPVRLRRWALEAAERPPVKFEAIGARVTS